ncbi:MAG: cytochrome c oxidase subunit II [Alphaproteobacteria bacterium]|nr:cytochrome c oxidase subunit II [Alphaproteobacteria bacterium]
MKFKAISLFLVTLFSTYALPAFADKPEPWGINFQKAASPLAERIHNFHDMMLWIIISIALFVLVLLIWVIIRYNHKANPEPRQFTHNVLIEVIWTLAPIVILIFIAIPSFQLLYYNDRTETPEMTLKIVGYQWYWQYKYPDHGDITFDSYMIAEKDITEGQTRLLSTDAQVVLPVDTDIQLLISAADVLHSWTVPAFGVKMDAIPGRWNEAWVRINEPGVYYGQCSELCGKDHAYMPIEIKAVSKEDYKTWALANGATQENFEKPALEAPQEEASAEAVEAPAEETPAQEAETQGTDAESVPTEQTEQTQTTL